MVSAARSAWRYQQQLLREANLFYQLRYARGPQVAPNWLLPLLPPPLRIVCIFTRYIAAKCELIHTKKKSEYRLGFILQNGCGIWLVAHHRMRRFSASAFWSIDWSRSISSAACRTRSASGS